MVYKYSSEKGDMSVLITERCLESISNILKERHPNEFGGILFGIRGVSQLIVVDMIPAVKYRSNSNTFIRNADELNKQLFELYTLSNGQLEYLGEWHSHPNGSAKYSLNDKNTMLKIASDIGVGFVNPILLIFSVSKHNTHAKAYMVFEKELLELKLTK
jgi:integrative and conjugative element protein (TIGR02256 family)